jgi:DNA helicase-2/ATP-dependent DNA helicase PcrA
VSYSQLSSYESCPKQYRYRYILKLPGYSNAALAFGSTIHNTLKDFYVQLKDFKHGLTGVVDQPDLDMLLSLYDKNWISSGYDTNHHESLRKKEGEEILKQFYKQFFDINTDPAFLEWSFNHELEDIIVRGMIDRVDYIDSAADSANGSSKSRSDKKPVRIIDYKTGKVRAKEGDKDFQLALYTMALERKTNFKVEEAALLYLEHGEYVKIDVSEKVREEAEGKVKGLVKEIRKGDFVPTPNMWVCKYCDYKAICKDAAL